MGEDEARFKYVDSERVPRTNMDDLRELRLALEASGIGLSRLNRDGVFTMVDAIYADLLGYEPTELLGKSWEAVVPASDQPRAIDAVLKCTSQGAAEVELLGLRKDGTTFVKQLNLVKREDSEGHHLGHYCIMRNITEKHSLQAQLNHAEKMRAIGQLTMGVAHNFNNMLQVIMTNTELLGKTVESESGQLVEDAMNAARRAMGVVAQLSVYARKPSRSPAEPVELKRLLENVVEVCRETFDRRIQLVTEIATDLPPIAGEAGNLETVFLNLLMNARDAVGDLPTEATPTISVSAQTLAVESAPTSVCVQVNDNGAGISEDDPHRIFEPFFTTKEVGSGTGLGLSTALAITNQHGGTLTLDTTPGEGSTFSVELPIGNLPRDVSTNQSSADQAESTVTRRVLVVEDEPLVRNSLRLALKTQGYEVLLAEDGDQALERVEAHFDELDAVILDVSLPKRSGLDVLTAIRAKSAELPVCILSGLPVESQELGDATEVLRKPVSPTVLFRTLARRIKS